MTKPIEIYNIEVPFIKEAVSDESQRTDEWFEDRRGRFTGSEMKKLMSCSDYSKRMEWGRAEKLIDFGKTARKYVYSRAKERQRKKVIKSATSAAMRYGSTYEDVVFGMLKEKYPREVFKKVGFIEFMEGVAGASPDGTVCIFSHGPNGPAQIQKQIIGLEIKLSTDWGGVYSRHEVAIDQSHQDFWQLQAEMLALNVKEIMYVVAEPPVDIFEPEITDLSIRYVNASPIHQEALKQRCMIGDEAIRMYLNGNSDINECIQIACTNFEIE